MRYSTIVADPPSDEDEFRMVNLSRAQRNAIAQLMAHGPVTAAIRDAVVDKWDKAPGDAWGEIADEFRRHRCKDGNCFAETVLMRLGALSYAGTLDWPPAPVVASRGAS